VFFLKARFLLQHIMQFHIMPFGICAGSENQGGQHEARDKPVQAATSHFTTMTVDGQNRDLVNIWRNVNIDGGDQLILYLGAVKRGRHVQYALNHWGKGTVTKIMKFPEELKNCTLQLVPSFYKAGDLDRHSTQGHDAEFVLATLFNQTEQLRSSIESAMDYRVAGYWHCGQTYTKASKFGLVSAPCSDLEYMNGALLQVNWAPVWKSGGLLEWYGKDFKLDVATSAGCAPSWVNDYDLTYIRALQAKTVNDLVAPHPRKRKFWTLVVPTSAAAIAADVSKMSLPATGAAAIAANVREAGEPLLRPLVEETRELGRPLHALAQSVTEMLNEAGGLASKLLPEQVKSSGLDGDNPAPSKSKTTGRRMAIPKISFLDSKESAEELELERIFTSRDPA
jgi:hypothetical protein